MKTQLTKREYLGKGYRFNFKHNETGELASETCDENLYNSLAEGFIPTKEGYVFIGADGGYILVDSQTNELIEGEFTILDETYYVCDQFGFPFPTVKKFSGEEFNSKYIWQ
jgi:hypothetical protein